MGRVQQLYFDELPTEILWRVARHCSAEACLQLTQVSHTLRNALFDRLVFKDIIIQNRLKAQAESLYTPKPPVPVRRRRTAEGLVEEPVQLRSISPTFDVARLEELLGDDLQAWIRVAVAESKAYQINKELPALAEKKDFDGAAKSLLLRIHKYGTALSTLHHPWVYGESVTKFLTQRLSCVNSSVHAGTDLEIQGGDDMLPAFSFNICAAALSNPKSVDTLRKACAIVAESSLRCEQEAADYPDSTVTQFALAACAALLENHLEGEADSDPQLPRLQDLPWITDIKDRLIPLPCAPLLDPTATPSRHFVNWSDWESDCVYRMTDPDYLEDGQWVGYWSFDGAPIQGIPTVQFADAIENLMFTVQRTRRSSRRSTPYLIRGSHPNAGNDFHLEGNFTRDGCFMMGPPGDFWAWRGRMTPFGMFGFWGSTDWSRVAGICWIWKKSWSDAAREERMQRRQKNLGW